ncbi:DUF6961 family protein [Sphingosinicella rhizophila]|uniref:Uncharacterized protein n=1 Tax=Sphingosinicella rhizophila TaxID=3050082 RepID=A0ABU3Q5F0_9SPHN|nr:hypothetical protein [Sphingosinicella sp. GR2756]MDT9598643.1 hypothetical protein [Sphingosinicella sp. GR2756]
MISDRELWACANEVMHQHGADAALHVAERIGALVLAGDVAGVTAWKEVARRIDALQSGSGTLN